MDFNVNHTFLKNRLPLLSLLLVLLFGTAPLSAQVVINEIQESGTVELKNLGSATVDVSNYWLCDFPSYRRLGSSGTNIIAGDLMLGPGEIIAIDNFNVVDSDDGEMGLYTSSSFGSSDAMIDYVEWGSAGHGRANVAIAAGIWQTGMFVSAFPAGESLAYTGSGDGVDSWVAGTPTIGADNNANASCDIVTNDITLDDGTTTNIPICVDGNPDPLTVQTNGGTGGTNVVTGWIITDAATGEILGTPAAGPFDLDGAGVGTCNIYYVRWEMGDFAGNTAGNNIADLTGCFDLSNPIVVYRQAPDGGTVALADGGTTATFPAGNVVFDVTHTTAANFLSYWYIITDDQDKILGWANSANTNTLDLSDAPAGTCRIWGWSYRGLDDPIIGDNISTLADDDCEAISDNWITIIRQPADCDIITNDIALADGSTETSICVDGNPDPIALGGNGGTGGVNVAVGWIITDAATGEILGLPASGPFDLDGAGPGTCNIYYVRWEMGMFGGNVVGNNIADLTGCFSLSNPVAVIREIPDGGTVSLADGSTAATFDAGNVVFEMAFETTAPNLSYWYIITDDQNEILGFQNSRTSDTLDLSPAPAGVCRVWGWSYRGLDDPIVGDNISTLEDDDCEAISSNWVTITREETTGTLERPTVNGLETFPNPFTDRLTVRATGIERVELYDALGKAVAVPSLVDPASAELETGGLAPGLYLLRVTTPEGIFVETVIHR